MADGTATAQDQVPAGVTLDMSASKPLTPPAPAPADVPAGVTLNLAASKPLTGAAPTPAPTTPSNEDWLNQPGFIQQSIIGPLARGAQRIKEAVLESEGPGNAPYDVNQLFNPTPAPPAATDQEAIARLKARNASTDPQQVELEKQQIDKMRSDRQFEVRNAKEYAEGGTQLVRPEKLLTKEEAREHPVLYGLARVAGSLTTKENAALLVGSGGLGYLGSAAAASPTLGMLGQLVSKAPQLVSAYFALSMGKGVVADYIPELVQAKKDYDVALQAGDQTKAEDILSHAKEQFTEAAASSYLALSATHHAATGHPDPVGKAVGDAFDIASDLTKKGAVAGAKGAVGLAGDATSAAWERATSAQKLVSGKANSVPDAILAASNVPEKLRPAHLEKIKDVENDLDYILNNNPNIVDPATAAKAIKDHNQSNENVMLAKAGATQGSSDAVVPNFENRLNKHLNKYFSDNAGRFGLEDVDAAKKDITARIMQRVQTGVDAGGNPVYTPRAPNLFESENARGGLNNDAEPLFGANAKPTTNAYKSGAFEAANFMREVIDESLRGKGVEGVKKFREKEAKLISVAKALNDAQGRSNARGEPGWGKAVWSKFGTVDAAIGIATGFLTGSAPVGVLTAIPGIVAHKAMQERTSPIGNINRAIDLAGKNPNAKATEVTVRPPNAPQTPPAGPTPPVAPTVPPAAPIAPAPAAAAAPVPVANTPAEFAAANPGSNVTTTPSSFQPTGQVTTPGVNHKLYSALSSHYVKVIGSVPFEDLQNKFIDDINKIAESGGTPSDRQQKLLETVNDSKAEQRLNAEKEQKIAADKAAKDAQKAAADQAKAAEKAQKEQQKKAEEIAKDKEEKAAAGLNTNFSIPFDTEDEIPLPARYRRGGYTGPGVRIHEIGHQIMVSEFGYPTGDVISHNHTQIDPGAAASARWDTGKLQNEKGEMSPELIAKHLPEILSIYYGGPIAEELVNGTPMETNKGASDDLKQIEDIMKGLGLDPTERARISKAAEMNTREVLTTPGVSDIIRRYTSRREAGIGNDLHMTPETVGKAVEEVKHARGGGGTGGEGGSNEPKTDNEKPATNEAGEGGKQAKPGGEGERKGKAEGSARVAGEEGAGAGSRGGKLGTNISYEGLTGLLESRRSEKGQSPTVKVEHTIEPKLENRLAHREEALRAEHNELADWKERVLALEKRLAQLEEPEAGRRRLLR
jgi:hypothetical protein